MKKATKTTKKAGTKRGAAAPTDYTKAKLDVQAQCVIGKSYTYSGINEAFKGKKVTVTGHEGRGGIFIKLGEKTLTCSPFALVGRPDAPKPKAKATQKAALKATKAKAKGKATAVTKAPEAAAPAAQAAPEEATAAPKKARKAA